jgi:carbonic anhydrase
MLYSIAIGFGAIIKSKEKTMDSDSESKLTGSDNADAAGEGITPDFEDSLLNDCCFCKEYGEEPAGHYHSTTETAMLRKMLEGNRDFLDDIREGYYATIKSDQTPSVTLLTCSDSRVHVNLFSFDPVNQLFIIRNIGNQIAVNAGSIEYGVKCLNTSILMVLGHTHCGAIKAALTGYHIDSPAILTELIKLPVDRSVENEEENREEFEKIWNEAVEANVDYQVEEARKRYHKEVKDGRLHIVGAVKDILNVYGAEAGRLVITNINSVKNIETIKKSALMREVPAHLKDICIRRITNV